MPIKNHVEVEEDASLGAPKVSPNDPQFGETAQTYDGEADVAGIIKENNIRRVYKQMGRPYPLIEEPELEPEPIKAKAKVKTEDDDDEEDKRYKSRK